MLTGFDPQHAPGLSDKLKPHAERVASVLSRHHRGRDKAVKAPRIEAALSLPGQSVRAIMNYLRDSHYPICSDSTGYWWATSQDEIDKTVAHLTERINSMQRARDGLRGAKI